MAEKLGLEQKQVEKMDEVSASFRKPRREISTQIRAIQEELFSLMQNPQSKRENIVEVAHKLYEKKMEGKMMQLKMRLDLREVLTAQQIEELATLKNHRHKMTGRKKQCFSRSQAMIEGSDQEVS